MKKTKTEGKRKAELVFILDRSGSMRGLESDTIGGYNAMMDKQRAIGGDITVTTVLFDDQYELLHDRVRLDELKPMTDEEYFVRGMTALIDAIGKTVLKIENAQAHTAKEHRADKVIFVITTDGYENASREFLLKDVKQMVEQKRETEGWEFIFLGANIDSIGTAEQFGIRGSRALNYCATSRGIELKDEVIGDMVREMVKNSELMSDIEFDSISAKLREFCETPDASDAPEEGKKEGSL